MPRIRVDADHLGTTATTLRTVAAGHQLTYCQLILFNGSDDAATASVWFVPSGDSSADSNKLLEYSLRSKETRAFDFTPFLNPGDRIIASASADTVIVADLAVLEES